MSKQLLKLTLAGTTLALALAAGPALAAPSVTGTVTYTGKVPALKPIDMAADPACAAKHTGPVASDMLVLGAGNTMGNVMVRVKGPVAGTFPAPSSPVVIDQKGCHYEPHVVGVMVGQTLQLKNSDGLLHNVHALPKVNTPFNMAMPANRLTADTKFGQEEGMFQVKCDVHGWMTAYVGVFANPFFAVTGADGKFTISGLPPGTYEIEAWHEKLGMRTASVTVTAAAPAKADFAFAPPSN
jgi:plastocyanin